MDGVQAAEARRLVNARLETAPDHWTTLELQAIPDFNRLAVSRVVVEPGSEAPPPKDGILLERLVRSSFAFDNGQAQHNTLARIFSPW